MDLVHDDEDVEDTHLCIKCKSTIVGLENYIKHRKTLCVKNQPATSSIKDQQLKDGTSDPYLGADVFFSSLELQSSAKKSTVPSSNKGVLTRKATAAILATNSTEWIEGNDSKLIPWTAKSIDHLGKKDDNQYGILDAYHREDEYKDTSESSEEEVDEAYDRPPTSHTGGKWKPRSPWSSSHNDWVEEEHTGGKWKPGDCDKTVKSDHYYDSILPKLPREEHEDDDETHPPPSHTKGKWIPGENSAVKYPPKTVKVPNNDFWCGPCNRKLSSKMVYDRHIASNLHRKRTRFEKELDFDPKLSKRNIKPSIYLDESLYPRKRKSNEKVDKTSEKKRKRRPLYLKCDMCKSRVAPHLFGKHLISHYHFRKADPDNKESTNLILKNIWRIVKQSPYQCQICHFYANFEDQFLHHWISQNHKKKALEYNGRFWCSFCKYETELYEEMTEHLSSQEHQEVNAVINRSVPIIIRKKTVIKCASCKEEFRYNIQLRHHVKGLHCNTDQSTASDAYQSKLFCEFCNECCKSKVALQRHKMNAHGIRTYFCSVCSCTFDDAEKSRLHRQSAQHKINITKSIQQQMRDESVKVNVERKCNHCSEVLDDIVKLKKHLEEKHPDKKYSCSKCNMTFTIPQEVSKHVRRNECSFEELSSKANRCKNCPYTTNSQAEILFHGVLHGLPTQGNRYACPLCHKMFRKHSLRCHLRNHTGERPFRCSQCQAEFIRKSALTEHITHKHSEQPGTSRQLERSFLCSICGACFTKKFTLQQHLHTHRIVEEDEIGSQSQQFHCRVEDCLYRARSSAELAIHEATHGTERPHRCPNCDYCSKTRPQLLKHMKLHQISKKSYDCPHCSYSGRLESQLAKHILQHGDTRGEKYCCPHCDFQCLTLENLRKHVLNTNKHIGQYLYNCELCPDAVRQGFNTAKELRKHLVLSHNEHFKVERDTVKYVMEFFYPKENKTEIVSSSHVEAININLVHQYTTEEVDQFQLTNMLGSPESHQNINTTANEVFTDQDFQISENNLSFEGVYNVDSKGVLIPYISQ